MQAQHRFKDSVYEQIARIGKALSAPKRLELLDLLCEGPRTVESMARAALLSTANASQHLRILHRAHLVIPQKRGLFVEYRIADGQVEKYLHLTQQVAEARLAEIREISSAFMERRSSLERIASDELVRRVRNGDVTVLDVRPVEEYRAGHIPGARSVPLAELDARMRELPKSREIVAYCRGRYCVMAVEAVELLRKAGYRAHRMEYGVRDWRLRGWRLEKTSP